MEELGEQRPPPDLLHHTTSVRFATSAQVLYAETPKMFSVEAASGAHF